MVNIPSNVLSLCMQQGMKWGINQEYW